MSEHVTMEFCEAKHKQNDKDHAAIMGMLSRIDECVRGNGKPGIRADVDRHDRILSALMWVVGVVIVAVVGDVIVPNVMKLFAMGLGRQ